METALSLRQTDYLVGFLCLRKITYRAASCWDFFLLLSVRSVVHSLRTEASTEWVGEGSVGSQAVAGRNRVWEETTMPQLDIVCATWNMENQEPSNPQIVQFCNALLKKPFQNPNPDFQNAPDFAVIGLQEAVPVNEDFEKGDLVSQLCVQSSAGRMENIMWWGEAVRGPLIKGTTKPPEPCCQHIGIMRRANSPWSVRNIVGKDKRKEKVPLVGGLLGGVGLGSEKGAVALVVDIEDPSSHECIRLVFVSTHLDAGKGQKKELEEYLAWSDTLATKGGSINRSVGSPIPANQVSNIGFIMGDLNFRLIEPQTQAPDLPDQNSDDAFWADVLLNPAKRGRLFQDYDGLQRNAYGQLRFPVPAENYDSPAGQHPVCFPTYQRFYDDSQQAATYVANIKGKGAGDPGAIVAIKHLFVEHWNKDGGIKPLWNEDREAWDMGWLDRIGYVIREPSNSKKITCQAVSCWDCFEMVQSDHTPVFMQLKVDVT
jgi:hypothetical protein